MLQVEEQIFDQDQLHLNLKEYHFNFLGFSFTWIHAKSISLVEIEFYTTLQTYTGTGHSHILTSYSIYVKIILVLQVVHQIDQRQVDPADQD